MISLSDLNRMISQYESAQPLDSLVEFDILKGTKELEFSDISKKLLWSHVKKHFHALEHIILP